MRIVVVEQDVAMRTLISEWLVADGNEVRTLGTPEGVRGVDAQTDLLVVDLTDLRASGAARVRELCSHFPGAAVVGMSTELARSLGPNSALTSSLGLHDLLAKPCSRDEVLQAAAAIAAAR